MKWAYAVTTVESRKGLLERTLASLDKAGFPVKAGMVRMDPHGNAMRHWASTAVEMYLGEPRAERYAIFQDDIVCVKGLREYLELSAPSPDNYLNLYTALNNELILSNNGTTPPARGWHLSNQLGKGALALVFSRAVFVKLLSSPTFWDKHAAELKPTCNIDGCVVTALTFAGVKEMVHWPSLVQHTGTERSSILGIPRGVSASFPGEEYHAVKGGI